MIVPFDEDYKQTKKIKLGETTIKSEFREFAMWIDQNYQVNTLNIFYDTIDRGKRPRLEIIFEFESESIKFKEKRSRNFDREKQNDIAKKFKQILLEQGFITPDDHCDLSEKTPKKNYLTENIIVSCGAFEPVARIETILNIPEEKIDDLAKSINSKDLWKISRCLCSDSVTFFLFTDTQLEDYKNSETQKEWASMFFDILEPYNEFGYFKKNEFSISLVSKENLDNNYEGSLFYYYR